MSGIERGNRDYFFCYNKNVSRFLTENGIKYITIAKDMNTNNIFSMYEITSKFQKVMDEYKEMKRIQRECK